MNRSAKTLIAIVITVIGSSLLTAEFTYAGGSGWGWAKPMNKRMGLFYTSNKNANFGRSHQKTSSNSYRRYSRYKVYPAPTTAPVVVPQYSVPHGVIPIHRHDTVPTTPVPHSIAPPMSAQPSGANGLPFKSTTSKFWQ